MSENSLKPDNLKQYVSQHTPLDKSKESIFQTLIDRGDDEVKVADAYDKLDLRERLEFQLDEFVRELNKLKEDDYIKILELLCDANSIIFLTIENRENDSNKGIYYGLMCPKIINIMKQFQPDLDIIPSGYGGLGKETYINDRKIGYLWMLGNMINRGEIGNSDKGSRKNTQLATGYLSSSRSTLIGKLKNAWASNN